MRMLVAVCAVLSLAVGTSAAPVVAAVADGGHVLSGYQQPDGTFDVEIDLDEEGGGWYANPLWIALGVVGLVALIALIASLARGGGTTVIKE